MGQEAFDGESERYGCKVTGSTRGDQAIWSIGEEEKSKARE
jgi:hypothetical protein